MRPWILAMALMLALAGCSDTTQDTMDDDGHGTGDTGSGGSGGSTGGSGTGGSGTDGSGMEGSDAMAPGTTASVYVKDAPTDDFAEIHLNFTDVEVHWTGNGTEGSGGWLHVFHNASGMDIDLLNASGSKAAFLGEVPIMTGNYTQVRVNVSDAYGIDHENETVPITVSSGTVRLNRPFEIPGGNETRIIVDIDLDNSLVRQGNGMWRMTPVIGSVQVDEVESSESGADVDEPGDIVEV